MSKELLGAMADLLVESEQDRIAREQASADLIGERTARAKAETQAEERTKELEQTRALADERHAVLEKKFDRLQAAVDAGLTMKPVLPVRNDQQETEPEFDIVVKQRDEFGRPHSLTVKRR